MNVTCILPKLILPDNARVAVLSSMHCMRKKQSNVEISLLSTNIHFSVFDLRSHHNVYCVAMKVKKVLFIYFSKVKSLLYMLYINVP